MNKFWWPPDFAGQLIIYFIWFFGILSIIAIIFCIVYRFLKAQKILKFLKYSFIQDTLGGVPKGIVPDRSTSEISQLEWWIRDIPSHPVDDPETLNTFLAAKADTYKLHWLFLLALNYLTEICSVYPMLGIFGTVLGVSYSIGQPDILMQSFSTAVITTMWGILIGIIHTVILTLFYAYLHELDEIPSKINASLYDLKQNNTGKE